MNEEKILKEMVGRRNPFTVPDGYFDRLVEDTMSKLPESRRARTVTMRSLLAIAASLLLAVVIGTAYYFNSDSNRQQLADNYDSEYVDDMADYAMLDNAEIYASLADY